MVCFVVVQPLAQVTNDNLSQYLPVIIVFSSCCLHVKTSEEEKQEGGGRGEDEEAEEGGEEFYNGEEYSYEYEVGSCCGA